MINIIRKNCKLRSKVVSIIDISFLCNSEKFIDGIDGNIVFV